MLQKYVNMYNNNKCIKKNVDNFHNSIILYIQIVISINSLETSASRFPLLNFLFLKSRNISVGTVIYEEDDDFLTLLTTRELNTFTNYKGCLKQGFRVS